MNEKQVSRDPSEVLLEGLQRLQEDRKSWGRFRISALIDGTAHNEAPLSPVSPFPEPKSCNLPLECNLEVL